MGRIADAAALENEISNIEEKIGRLERTSHHIEIIVNQAKTNANKKMAILECKGKWSGNKYDKYMYSHSECQIAINRYFNKTGDARKRIAQKITELEIELAACRAALASL